jgi:hypothetical protein
LNSEKESPGDNKLRSSGNGLYYFGSITQNLITDKENMMPSDFLRQY